MDEQELKGRTKAFALRVLKVVEALPKTIPGKAVADQLIRSGTSVAANYRAACIRRSKAEFAAKLGTVLEETDESCYWLEFIADGGLLPAETVTALHAEGEELRAIFLSSVRTAKGIPNQKSPIPVAQPPISNPKSQISNPLCPECGKPMRQRTAKAGPHAGQPFWGCTGYPACKGVREVDAPRLPSTPAGSPLEGSRSQSSQSKSVEKGETP